jgi:hypothetical protein
MWVVLLDGVGGCASPRARGISRPRGRKGPVSRPRTSDCCRGARFVRLGPVVRPLKKLQRLAERV